VRQAPIKDTHGNVVGAGEVSFDVTEQARAEDEIRRHSEELQITNNELARFNSTMADRELRMIELKNEINDLRCRLGLPPHYSQVAEKERE
jgi:hypothetical protein